MIKGKCGELELPFDDVKKLAEEIGSQVEVIFYKTGGNVEAEKLDEVILTALINSGYFAVPEDD